MNHSYTKTIWEDAPSTETPISADNLNNIENGLGAIYYEVGLLEQEIERLKSAARSHVGMIIISSALDTEAKVIELYGGTHWVPITGRFLLGASSQYPNGSAGGSANAKVVSHSHGFEYKDTCAKSANGIKGYAEKASGSASSIPIYNVANDEKHGTTISTGTSGAGANMPPYAAVYIWKRTS